MTIERDAGNQIPIEGVSEETILDRAVAFSDHLPQIGVHPTVLFEISQRARSEAHAKPAVEPSGQSDETTSEFKQSILSAFANLMIPKFKWGLFSAFAGYFKGKLE